MNVLSTTRTTFLRRQMALIAARSLEAHQRIGRRLDINHSRVLPDRTFDILRVGSVDVGKLQPETAITWLNSRGVPP